MSPPTIAELEVNLKPIHEKHQTPLSYASGKRLAGTDSFYLTTRGIKRFMQGAYAEKGASNE